MEQSNNTQKVDGSGLKITVIVPYFNEEIGLEMYENAKKELIDNEVKEENISLTRVAGALEIPLACQKIIEKETPDAVLAFGAVIRGETSHYDMVCNETYRGIMEVQLKTGVPIGFGVLTCETVEQAKERSSVEGLNKGAQVAQATLIQTTI